MNSMTFLPRLSHSFWAYLEGLDRNVARLLSLIERERLMLLKRDFKSIMTCAQAKDELLKRIGAGEERLLNIMREVLKKADREPAKDLDDGIQVVRAFKKILDFKDLARFESWHTRYTQMMMEARLMNSRNRQWAEEGLRETIELSQILMGRHGYCGGQLISKGLIYNENGQLDGRLD